MKLIIEIDEDRILDEFVGYDRHWLIDDKVKAVRDAEYFAENLLYAIRNTLMRSDEVSCRSELGIHTGDDVSRFFSICCHIDESMEQEV
ncbi:hypothetical protein N9K35_01640 [Pseudomonadales bacterium]|nr:hypothetical protein [Pseudomonadales bacterium]